MTLSIILLQMEPISWVFSRNKAWGRQAGRLLLSGWQKEVSWVTPVPERNKLKSQGSDHSDTLVEDFSILVSDTFLAFP